VLWWFHNRATRRSTLRCPCSPLQTRNIGVHFWRAGGEQHRELFERVLLPHARDNRCATGLINFAHFLVGAGQIVPGKAGRAICTANFAISGGTKGRCCCGHICVGKALHCISYKRSHAAITIPEERLQYVLRVHFPLWDGVEDGFDPFSATTPIYILANFNFLIYLFHEICLHLINTVRLFPADNAQQFLPNYLQVQINLVVSKQHLNKSC